MTDTPASAKTVTVDELYKALGVTREQLRALADKHGIESVAVFGSFARGEQRPDSDVDILITRGPRHTFDDFLEFKETMEARTGRHIDLATEKMLHWYIKDRVLKDARSLL